MANVKFVVTPFLWNDSKQLQPYIVLNTLKKHYSSTTCRRRCTYPSSETLQTLLGNEFTDKEDINFVEVARFGTSETPSDFSGNHRDL